MLGPSQGGLGGQDAPDGFPASGRNAYPSGANAFFADVVYVFSSDSDHRTLKFLPKGSTALLALCMYCVIHSCVSYAVKGSGWYSDYHNL